MTNKIIHIVSFDVCYPPNYGGVIDVFYKIKALHNIGVKVILHSYQYGRESQDELEMYTFKNYYYQRDTRIVRQISILPYVVNSRNNTKLLSRLLEDDHPILFEGLHTCRFLHLPELQHRTKLVRAHNVEHDYYRGLARREKQWFRRLFFYVESSKLKRYEKQLGYCDMIGAISRNDMASFESRFHNVFLLPPFHSNDDVCIDISDGDFMLYHGSLDVAENIEAALFLVNIFKDTRDLKLVIAGKNPDNDLCSAILDVENIDLISNPSSEDMKSLVQSAHINILPTFQPTGIKLKLLEALYSGKHVLCNSHMVAGTGLEGLCHIADSSQQFIQKAKNLLTEPFTDAVVSKRVCHLEEQFDNKRNAMLIMDVIERCQEL